MKLSPKQQRYLFIGVALLAVITYVAMDRTGMPGTNSNGDAPEREDLQTPVMAGVGGVSDLLGIRPDGSFGAESRFWHFFSPHDEHLSYACNYGYHTRHRYPTISGSNVSALIHHGYSSMMIPAQHDRAWLVNPPSEVAF